MSEEKEQPGRHVLSVTELNSIIKDLLEGAFPGIWVEGEISNFKIYSSGHIYFTLKDAGSQVRGVMWKGSRKYLRFTPKDGDKVLIRGRISVYNKRGEYQLVAEAMEPKGLGALQAAFEELKKKLAAEGLFDEARKKPIPFISWSIGIVTSPTGAAIRDMIRTINRRFPGLRIVVNPSLVQGDGAAAQISKAIKQLNEYGKVDVIIVGRGGGSLEDLWAFNEEPVARAIAASRIPIVSAVGHEVDFTIADFVADLRASTPTAAAELVAPDKEALQEKLDEGARKLRLEIRGKLEVESQFVDDLMDRLASTLRSGLELRSHKLAAALGRLKGLNPINKLALRKQRLAGITSSLNRALFNLAATKGARAKSAIDRFSAIKPMKWTSARKEKLDALEAALIKQAGSNLTSQRARLEKVSSSLAALDPAKVLERGYSIVTRDDGQIAKSVVDLKPGARVTIRVSDGQAGARIEGESSGGGKQEELF